MSFSEVQIAVFIVAPILAGAVKGIAGFGFSLVGTSLLAVFLKPSQAVTLFIIPLMAIEVELLNELTWNQFRHAVRRFRYYLVAAAAGTVLGTLALQELPGWPIKAAIGLMTTGFALQRTGLADGLVDTMSHLRPEAGEVTKSLLGFSSGVVFGATNIGVQFTAYLKSLELGRSKFLGVLAMVAFGVSVIRIGLSLSLGLFRSTQGVAASIGMAAVSLVSVYVFTRLGDRIPKSYRERLATALLLIIGLRLLLSALSV
nr:MAG: sulfite exporter TauE/SafE [Candidatus Nanosalinarum sp. J07AB56]